MALKFGDIVEIPERDHALGDRPVGLTASQREAIEHYLKGRVELVAGDRKVEIPIEPWSRQSLLGSVLATPPAQDILMSSSELSHVKVIRRDPTTGKTQEWILDCSRFNSSAGDWAKYCPGLWLRNGDVIEVPEKP